MEIIRKLNSRTPKDIARACRKICRRQYGVDRAKVWIDHPAPNLPIAELNDLCGGGVDHQLGAMPFHPRWKSSIELYQPSRRALKLLADALAGTQYDAEISYVELACDLITRAQGKAEALGKWLLGHVWLKSCRERVVLDKNGTTYYYHRRHDGNGRKSPKVLALYADKPSKLPGRRKGEPCCHIEFRLSGAAAVKRAGIVSVGDLLDFDHAAFWTQGICLASWKSKADLGRAVYAGDAEISGAALRKHANMVMREYDLKGTFVMQNALLEEPDLRNVTSGIDPAIIFCSATI